MAEMQRPKKTVLFRVRYGETDQMGTYSNSAVLDWFEHGRTELLRSLGLPYSQMEARGIYLPVVEAHVRFRGRARYDDLLKMTTTGTMFGKARVRCDVSIVQEDTGVLVADGFTIHAVTDSVAKPMRPPEWLHALFDQTPSHPTQDLRN